MSRLSEITAMSDRIPFEDVLDSCVRWYAADQCGHVALLVSDGSPVHPHAMLSRTKLAETRFTILARNAVAKPQQDEINLPNFEHWLGKKLTKQLRSEYLRFVRAGCYVYIWRDWEPDGNFGSGEYLRLFSPDLPLTHQALSLEIATYFGSITIPIRFQDAASVSAKLLEPWQGY